MLFFFRNELLCTCVRWNPPHLFYRMNVNATPAFMPKALSNVETFLSTLQTSRKPEHTSQQEHLVHVSTNLYCLTLKNHVKLLLCKMLKYWQSKVY